MKKNGIVIIALLVCMQGTAGISFAQGKNDSATPTPRVKQMLQTPTPDPTKAALTITPTPTGAFTTTPMPSTQTPQVTQPASTSVPIHTTQTNDGPTPTPQIVSPLASYTVTPTPKPKPIALTTKTPPPSQPISRFITAPFDLAMHVLPKDYYDEQGLTPATTKISLLLALLSLLSGTILLAWPSLRDAKNRIFATSQKEKRIIYLRSGKGLLKV